MVGRNRHPREGQATGAGECVNPHRTQTIARIDVAESKVRRGERVCRIFVDRDSRIRSSRRFIDIGQIDRERLVVGEPAAVRHAHGHAVARRRFIVQEAPIRHRDLARAAVDRKPPARTIHEAVRLGVARVGIGPTHRPDHRPIRRILRHGVRREGQIRWSLIDVHQVDREGLVVGEPAAVRHAHGHAVARRRFIVQEAPIRHRDLTRRAVDRKPASRRIDHAVGERLAGIRIFCRHKADVATIGTIFVNRQLRTHSAGGESRPACMRDAEIVSADDLYDLIGTVEAVHLPIGSQTERRRFGRCQIELLLIVLGNLPSRTDIVPDADIIKGAGEVLSGIIRTVLGILLLSEDELAIGRIQRGPRAECST